MHLLPKITVVTPSFRSAGTIEQTINSVLSQDYPNFEYIVIDGAGDETADILKRYSENITYWCSEPDHGQYDAIRKGFARATGDILCWINADDKLLPDALQIVGQVFADFPDVDWLSSLAPGYYDARGYYRGHGSISGFSRQAFLDGFFLPGTHRIANCIQQESTFFRRTLFENVDRPFGGCGLAGDFALWCQFYRRAELIGIEYPLAGFRYISGQRSEDMSAYVAEARPQLNELQRSVGHVGRGKMIGLLPFSKIPRLGENLPKYLCYQGKKICKEQYKFRDASWKLLEYGFLP